MEGLQQEGELVEVVTLICGGRVPYSVGELRQDLVQDKNSATC